MAAYGYGFPETPERLARLGDDLGVITAMLAGDKHQHATYEGRTPRPNARNIPKPIQQPRVPIMVGGNGPNVTWRLAAQHADELNVDGMSPAEVAEALPVIRGRCEEIGRDPDTLKVSVHIWGEDMSRPGASGSSAWRPSGSSASAGRWGSTAAAPRRDDALEVLADDARAAGVELA